MVQTGVSMKWICLGIVFALEIWACALAIEKDSNRSLNTDPSPNSLTFPQQTLLGDVIQPECWNFTHGNQSAGEFYSPRYPNDYPNNIECVRYIEALPGFDIHVDFRGSFYIEPSSECSYDSLEFRDGPFGYSPLLGVFCGKEFPPVIKSSSRFLWIRFKSDKNVGQSGFRAVYSFVKKENFKEEEEKLKVCRMKEDGYKGSGSLTSAVFPLADVDSPSYDQKRFVDCTWEIQVKPGSKIRLFNIQTVFPFAGNCRNNIVEIYDRSTSAKHRVMRHCSGPVPDFVSESSRIYIRMYGSRLLTQPKVKLHYVAFRKASVCDVMEEFSCANMCLPKTVLCDGVQHCPKSVDEDKCVKESSQKKTEIPLYMIIGGAVVGVVITTIIICVCVVCYHRRHKSNKNNEREMRGSQQDTTMEMSQKPIMTSPNKPTQHPAYYSLPRPPVKGQGHRNSLTNSQSPSEGEVPDQHSDPGHYQRKFPYEEDSSPCPSVYNQPVLTTIVERNDGSYGWSGYGWKPPRGQTEIPRGVTSPSLLSENIAKLAQYSCPPRMDPQYPMTKDFRVPYPPDNEGPDVQPYSPAVELKMRFGSDPDDFHKHKLLQQNMRSAHPDITRDLDVT